MDCEAAGGASADGADLADLAGAPGFARSGAVLTGVADGAGADGPLFADGSLGAAASSVDVAVGAPLVRAAGSLTLASPLDPDAAPAPRAFANQIPPPTTNARPRPIAT